MNTSPTLLIHHNGSGQFQSDSQTLTGTEALVRQLLATIGEDPTRQGLSADPGPGCSYVPGTYGRVSRRSL
jgi:hypothetical protein